MNKGKFDVFADNDNWNDGDVPDIDTVSPDEIEIDEEEEEEGEE